MTIDPVQLAHGVTVTVNVPQMPQVCPAPEAPTPGGVTVPVQGGLTAEQFAHIVAAVTAKVVEELGGQPGGGGAGIDDTTIGADITWSSQKTSDELAGKADDQWLMMDPQTGEWSDPMTGDPVPEPDPSSLQFGVGYALSVASSGAPFGNILSALQATDTRVAAEMPESPIPGTLYLIRAADGTIAWQMPIPWV